MPTLPVPENKLPATDSTNETVNYGIGARWSVGLLLVGGLSGLLTMLVIVALVCASARSPRSPAMTFGFNRCGNTGCFRGLIPGFTPWGEAQVVFNNRTRLPFDPPDGEIRLYPSLDGEMLGRILIRLPDDGSLSASDVVGLYGPPCGVTLYPQSAKFLLRYPTMRFDTPSMQDALRPDTPILLVEFNNPADQGQGQALSCFESRLGLPDEITNRLWHGFTSLARYLTKQ